MSRLRAQVIALPANHERKRSWRIAAGLTVLLLLLALAGAGAGGVFASDGCPHPGSDEVDSRGVSGTWFAGGGSGQPDHTVAIAAGATEYCYKAGQDPPVKSRTPVGGSFNDDTPPEWIIDGMEHALSHWVYFVPNAETETPTPTPETPTPTPETPTPTDTPPTPTETPPCEECEETETPTPTDTPPPSPTPTPKVECKLIPQYEQWRLVDSTQKEGYLPACYIISVDAPSVERQATLCTVCGDALDTSEDAFRFKADSWQHGTVYLNECTGEYVFIEDGGEVITEWQSEWFRAGFNDNIRTSPRCPTCEARATAQANGQ